MSDHDWHVVPEPHTGMQAGIEPALYRCSRCDLEVRDSRERTMALRVWLDVHGECEKEVAR